MFRFFLARGLTAQYCVIAIDVYDVQVGNACGGAIFGGTLLEGVRFEFGEFYARAIPDSAVQGLMSPHLAISIEPTSSERFPAVEEVVSRAQRPSDTPSMPDESRFWGSLDAFRLLAVDGDTSYFVSMTTSDGTQVCILASSESDDGTGWGTGGCGSKDVVTRSPEGLPSHFSADGFEGETPPGWREVMLRVKGPTVRLLSGQW